MISELRSKESNVGRQLTDATTRKLIMLMLFILFTNPIFHLDTYQKWPDGHSYGLSLLSKIDRNKSGLMETVFD